MSEKILNTRVILKHDTLENWNKDSAIILKEGEIALAKVSVNKADPISGELVKVPTYLIKVGDGTTKFSELNWVTAPAADVYDWAKKSEADFTAWVKTLVTVDDIDLSNYYTKGEVDGLVEGLGNRIGGVESDIQDTNNNVADLGEELRTAKSDLEGTISSNFESLSQEISGLDSAKVDKVNGKGLSTNDLTDELKGQYDDAYAHSQVAHAPADAQKNIIESVKVNGTAQTVAADKSVDITVPTVAGDVGAYTTGETDAKISEAITNFTKAYIESDDNEAIDKLQEIADWIANDINGASGLVADVAANATAIDALEGRMDDAEEVIGGLGTMATETASNYYTKTEADAAFTDADEVDGQIDAKITALGLGTMSKETASNYYTKTEADAAFTDADEVDGQIDAKIEALDLPNIYQAKGDYATAAQGAKADTALQEITTTENGGLKVTDKNKIDIDDTIVFVFDCGNSGVVTE